MTRTTECSAAVAQQLDACSEECGTWGALQATLQAAEWVGGDGLPIGPQPAVYRTVPRLVRAALRHLRRDEALVIRTTGHVLCVDGRHRTVIDTARPEGRDRRAVLDVLFIRRPSRGEATR